MTDATDGIDGIDGADPTGNNDAGDAVAVTAYWMRTVDDNPRFDLAAAANEMERRVVRAVTSLRPHAAVTLSARERAPKGGPYVRVEVRVVDPQRDLGPPLNETSLRWLCASVLADGSWRFPRGTGGGPLARPPGNGYHP